jgi:excisionase family DNA binding protein
MVKAASRWDRTVMPPEGPLEDLQRVLHYESEAEATLEVGGERLTLPAAVMDIVRAAVDAMAEGQAVTIAPIHRYLTTQEAADLLGISRPTLVKLLENKAIDYSQPGRHRRLLLTDVLAYRERRVVERRAALDQMIEIGEQEGVYEATPRPVRTR